MNEDALEERVLTICDALLNRVVRKCFDVLINNAGGNFMARDEWQPEVFTGTGIGGGLF